MVLQIQRGTHPEEILQRKFQFVHIAARGLARNDIALNAKRRADEALAGDDVLWVFADEGQGFWAERCARAACWWPLICWELQRALRRRVGRASGLGDLLGLDQLSTSCLPVQQ